MRIFIRKASSNQNVRDLSIGIISRGIAAPGEILSCSPLLWRRVLRGSLAAHCLCGKMIDSVINCFLYTCSVGPQQLRNQVSVISSSNCPPGLKEICGYYQLLTAFLCKVLCARLGQWKEISERGGGMGGVGESEAGQGKFTNTAFTPPLLRGAVHLNLLYK